MSSKNFSRVFGVATLLAASVVAAPQQFRGFQAASVLAPQAIKVVPGERFSVPLTVRIRDGYHINSAKPLDEYLIPTQVRWETPGFEVVDEDFPEPEIVDYEFSDEPLSVYSGEIKVKSVLRAEEPLPANATDLRGKFRYQACTEKTCLPPKTIELSIPILTASEGS